MKGDKVRKKGKLIISCCILFVIMLFIGLAYWILISIPRERMKGCYFGYEQMPIMSNEKYTGKIDAKMEHILIEDHAGTKVTELDLLGNSPDQVVLGEKTFFLLYRWDCQTAHCGRYIPHFDFGAKPSPIVPYRHLPQSLSGMTADCRSLV